MKYQTIIINDLAFKVFLVEKNSIFLKMDEPDLMNAGITDYHDLKIYVDKTMPICLVQKTMMHELTHAYLFAYGCHCPMDEEEICDFVSSYLHKIRCDYKYLYDELIVPVMY